MPAVEAVILVRQPAADHTICCRQHSRDTAAVRRLRLFLLLISTASPPLVLLSLHSRPCIVRAAAANTNSAAFTAVRRTEILPVNTEVSSVTHQSILSFSGRCCRCAAAAAGPFILSPSLSCRPLILFRVTMSQVWANGKHLNHVRCRYTASN